MKDADGWVFIVNPIAGSGFGGAYVATVREMMAAHGIKGEIALTRAKGHATELAARHAESGFRTIVGVGGDGTIAEVAQALVAHPEVRFGAVAAGTGNDFIHMLGFPSRFAEADWRALFHGETAAMDVGRCNGKYFINGMGLGFDAQVAYENYHMEDGGEVRGGGKAKYAWHIAKTVLLYKARSMRITIDGKTEERHCFLNTISNGRRIAGGLMLTPLAVADDGKLDYLSTGELTLPRRLRGLLAISRKTHLDDPLFRYVQTGKIEVEFDEEVPAHLDGEVIFARRFVIDVLPRALQSIIKPDGGHYFGGDLS